MDTSAIALDDKPAGYGYRPDQEEFEAYMRAGEARALALPNRGPIRFEADGQLARHIREAYAEYGFYIFEDVFGAPELAEIEADVEEVRSRLPVTKGADVDAQGRPALTVDCTAPTLFWSKPLGDPMGGTNQASGRHQIKMFEPKPASDAPDKIVYLILGTLQFSEASLRAYAHPDLLAVAAAINGPDFVPFTDAWFLKEPGRGAAVSWHQDGATHWDNPNWDPDIHGFNFMAQLYGSTPENGVWVVPGSHRQGKIDIKELVAVAGSERLPDAVPLVCKPGDVAINNRQMLHGSFANTSPDWRVTINMGFHRRSSVEGVEGGGLHAAPAVFDAERIDHRARLIGYAIDARRQHYPDETPFTYQPHAEAGRSYNWDADAKADLHDYNLLDLSI